MSLSTQTLGTPLRRDIVAASALTGIAGLAAVLAITEGPVLAGAFLCMALFVGLVFRVPAVALALPVAVAPIALREIPGAGGAQVIHLASVLAVGLVALGMLSGRVGRRPPISLLGPATFVAAIVLASVASELPVLSARVSFNHLLGLLLAVAAAALIRGDPKQLVVLLRIWTASCLIVALPTIASGSTLQSRFGGSLIEGRLQGSFTSPNDFGEFALLALVSSSALVTVSTKLVDRLLGAVGALAFSLSLVLSLSRGAWLGAAVGMLVALVLVPRLLIPAGIAISILVSLALITPGAQGPAAVALDRVRSITGERNPGDDRPLIWDLAQQLFIHRPLLGHGPGTFKPLSQEPGSLLAGAPVEHAHDIPLHVAAEAGLVGLIALLIATSVTAWVALRGMTRLREQRRTRDATVLAVFLAGLAAVAVHGLVDVVYTNPFLVALLWLFVGTVHGLSAASPTSPERDPTARGVAS